MHSPHLFHAHRARRLAGRLGTATLLLAILSGCSALSGVMPSWLGGEKDPTPPAKLPQLTPEVTPTKLWSSRLTKGNAGRRLYLVPALGGGRLYAADANGRVVGADADNGRTLWSRDTGLPFSAGPELVGDRLVLGTTNGLAVALSAANGQELWRATLSGEVLSVPRGTGEGKVIVHTLDDTVTALDAARGTDVWRAIYPAPVLTLRGTSTPAITPSGAIAGLSGGKLVKLDLADGAPLWEVTVTPPSGRSELARISDIDADPIVVGNVIFVATYNGDLAAVDLSSGTVLWRRELSSHAGLAANDSSLFITDSKDQVWGANPTDGSGRWKQDLLRYRQLTAPAPIGNLLAVGDLDGWLHLLAQSDGRLVGRIRISSAPITVRPLVSGGRLYVSAADGTVAALSVGQAPAGGGRTRAGGAATGDDAILSPPGAPAGPAPAGTDQPPAATPTTPNKTP